MRGVGSALVMVVALAAGCAAADDPGARTDDGRLRVVAGFYPLAEAAERVGGAAVEVLNLTPAGAEPHDLELSTRQVDHIEDAAVVLYLGQGFQPAVERAASRASGTAVDLLATASADDGEDPHVWLDPTLQRRIVADVQAALAGADPARAAEYQANAAAYAAELDGLHDEFRRGLADCDRRVIVTSHAAFGHLARRYDLVQEPIAGLSPAAEPEPRRLAELVTVVKEEAITTVFFETLVASDVAETLAREAGVGTAVLDPIEGLADSRRTAGETYASVMRENLGALRAALGCR